MSKIAEKFIELSHGSLGGLQGGQDGEYYHLTAAEYHRAPGTPKIELPLDGDIDIDQAPQIVGSGYVHPYDVRMYRKHIQIATDDAFGDIVWEDDTLSETVAFQVPLKGDGTSWLSEGTTYHVRIRYGDRQDHWSEWSRPISFTTMAAFPDTILIRPVMTAPASNGYASAVDPILGMSTPKVMSGLLPSVLADWQISTDKNFEGEPLYDVRGSSDTVFHVPQGVDLGTSAGVEFYARGGHRIPNTEETRWAHPVRFRLRPEYEDPVFGVRRIFSKRYDMPIVYNIDPSGEPAFIPRKYFDEHPIYRFPREDIVIGQDSNGVDVIEEMVRVSPCYMKHDVYDNEDGDMVIDMWFAMAPQGEGWDLHPAFTRSPNGFLYGIAVCAGGGIKIGTQNVSVPISKAGVSAHNSTVGKIQNIPGEGWHCWTIWERMLIFDLLMAERTTISREDIASSFPYSNAAPCMEWRGLWSLIFNGAINIYGAGFQYSEDLTTFDHVLVMTPLMTDRFIEIPMTLPLIYGMTVTDIYRGYRDELGVDVALLGIPKDGVNGVGNREKKTAFGMEYVVPNSRYPMTSRNFIQEYQTESGAMDLFGLLSGGNTSYSYSRISKWMD